MKNLKRLFFIITLSVFAFTLFSTGAVFATDEPPALPSPFNGSSVPSLEPAEQSGGVPALEPAEQSGGVPALEPAVQSPASAQPPAGGSSGGGAQAQPATTNPTKTSTQTPTKTKTTIGTQQKIAKTGPETTCLIIASLALGLLYITKNLTKKHESTKF